MNEIKLFVLIPAYNVEKYLAECLDSILNQNYVNFEVILVEDGATDSTGAICDRYAAADDRIHVIHKQNDGLLRARLTAIDALRSREDIQGSYCIFVDSDDMLMPGALETINRKLAETDCDLLVYGLENFNDRGVYNSTLGDVSEEVLITDMSTLFREALAGVRFNSLCRKAVRTNFFFFSLDEAPEGIQMAEDLLLSLEIYKQNPRTLIIPDILYRYRDNPKSITHTFKINRVTQELTAKQHVVDLVRSLNIWTEEDFDRYRENCLELMHWNIKDVLLGSPSHKETIENLKIAYNHPFTQEFYLEGITPKSGIWLREYAKQHFETLYFLNVLRKIKRNVIHMDWARR